jgi:hypothetical protein
MKENRLGNPSLFEGQYSRGGAEDAEKECFPLQSPPLRVTHPRLSPFAIEFDREAIEAFGRKWRIKELSLFGSPS